MDQAKRYSVCLCYHKNDVEVISDAPTSSVIVELINQLVYAEGPDEALQLSISTMKGRENLEAYTLVAHVVTPIEEKILTSKINTNENEKED